MQTKWRQEKNRILRYNNTLLTPLLLFSFSIQVSLLRQTVCSLHSFFWCRCERSGAKSSPVPFRTREKERRGKKRMEREGEKRETERKRYAKEWWFEAVKTWGLFSRLFASRFFLAFQSHELHSVLSLSLCMFFILSPTASLALLSPHREFSLILHSVTSCEKKRGKDVPAWVGFGRLCVCLMHCVSPSHS